MIGFVLLLIGVPVAVAAIAYGDYGAEAAAGAGLGALMVTAAIVVLPFAALIQAKRRDALGQPPIRWIDEDGR
jgi:hypothetical protein